MFLFTTAKNNLSAKFKTQFSDNPKGHGYLYYPKEYDEGYTCSEADYLRFISDFQKFMKLLTLTMWIWFLIGMPVIIGLAIWQDYEFGTLEKVIIIMFPLPFLSFKGLKVYNAPQVLATGNRLSANRRNQKQILESRIEGMSWSMLILLLVVPIIGFYVFIKDASLVDWEISLGICIFVSVFTFGAFLVWKKRKLDRKKN